MQFVIVAHDGLDSEALQRRQAAREARVQNIDNNMAHMIMGAMKLAENGEGNGSVLIVDFPTRAAFDAWLKLEPYVVQQVWKEVTVSDCKVGPCFLKQG